MIYGPSYISSEYALSYYGLIPERVEVLTSVTLQYKKVFQTPVGTFFYYTIPKKVYAYGIDWIEIEKNRFVLMADMEKALLDKIYLDRGIYFHSLKDVELYLFENLRVDENLFFSLKRKKLDLYIQKYQSKKLELIFKFFLSKKDGK
jgi:predicted transcriptional regulator of viral defense system